MRSKLDAQLGHGALVNLYLAMLVIFGFDPEGMVRCDGVLGQEGRKAQDRLNYLFVSGFSGHGYVSRHDICLIFGNFYAQALRDNVPEGFSPDSYDRAWYNAQRRFNIMCAEERDASSFNNEDDLKSEKE